MPLPSRHIAVDLGSSTIRLRCAESAGVWSAPHLAVVDDQGAVRAWGEEAWRMAGRTPPHLRLVRPVTGGAVTDLALAARLLGSALRVARSGRKRMRASEALVCVPDHATSMERHVLRQVCKDAGLNRVTTVTQSVAAAVGAGVSSAPAGALLVDIGADRSSAAMIAFGAALVTRTVPRGAGTVDQRLVRHTRETCGLTVSRSMAEEAKLAAGREGDSVSVRGQDSERGMPRTTEISLTEIREVLRTTYEDTGLIVSGVLDSSPPELVDDVMDRGVLLCGAGAGLYGLDAYLRERLRIPVHVAEAPGDASIQGAFDLGRQGAPVGVA
ncbi:rod shape-determining protein MreB [Streptomyces tsukubensis]|uniref:Rod shape-determining protein MreB n=2 Tax=Streptomyces tsukubensis TaxID=83656 RepID=A0A1V4A041_9ACTN|nr:rod shape-determining protein MreB [Streptomyces tsukubensis]QFR98198.1 rod shape-determining protein MreB [Streptomyces tsukubensis]